VAFGYKVAGIGSRFLAALVDTLIILFLQIVVSIVIIFIIRPYLNDDFNINNPVVALLIGLLSLVAFFFFWGYYILFEMMWNGQSVGKRWVGLRVIKADGTPITLTESIVRNFVRLIDFMPAYYGVGVVTMFINSQSRRLGDLAAGTLVVHDRVAITLESLSMRSNAPSVLRSAATATSAFPVERLTARDLQIAEDFLLRKNDLYNRTVLAQRILENLTTKMELPQSALDGLLTDSNFPEDYVAAIVKAARDHQAAAS
jgi:uncharacterized RDD family membrane protein YckC